CTLDLLRHYITIEAVPVVILNVRHRPIECLTLVSPAPHPPATILLVEVSTAQPKPPLFVRCGRSPPLGRPAESCVDGVGVVDRNVRLGVCQPATIFNN